MSYKVVIPTAGIGSRLYELSKNINKSLIPINNKPVISHIIEKFPKNAKFVIPIGFKGELVKDYLKISYPKKKFIFVKIKNFSGKGSGLGLTLLNAKKYLQEPFVFISCDTIVKEKIIPPNYNWIGYSSKTTQDSSFRRCLINKNYLQKLVEKNEKDSKNQFPYIGLCGVKNYKDFWKTFEKSKKYEILKGESYAIQKMLTETKFKAKKFTWHDVGNLKSYEKTKRILKKKNNYNILEKSDEAIWFVNNKVIKYSNDVNFIKKRYLRTKYLKNYVPKVINLKKNFYAYNLIEGKIFSSNSSLQNFKKLLKFSKKFWKINKLKNATKKQKIILKKFYKDKTLKRINLFYKKYGPEDNLKKKCNINNKKILPLQVLLNKVNWEDLYMGSFTRFHGDYHFENILMTNKNNNFLLLDWRQDFEGLISKGDIYYDLAKLLHGMIVSHPQVNLNRYKIKNQSGNTNINIFIPKNLKKCRIYFYKWLKKNNLSQYKVDVLTSLIFLNIAALHHTPYNKFLFNLGKIMLQNSIENREFYF